MFWPTEIKTYFSFLLANCCLSCSVVCILSWVVSRWNLVVCGCPGNEIKAVPKGLCYVVTDSHTPPSHLTHWTLTVVAAPSSRVSAGWSELYSLQVWLKPAQAHGTGAVVLSVTPPCAPAAWRIITAGQILLGTLHAACSKMFAECNNIRRQF